MIEKLKFETFTEFCDRADEILDAFKVAIIIPTFKKSVYKDYIYNNHHFSDNAERDMLAKDKCWMWVLSCEYEKMDKNDLYCTLGQLKKGK